MDTPRFVKKLQGDRLEWGFEGKHAEDIKDVTVEDVRWLLPYLGRITREQLVAAFRASGATVRQAGCWTDSIQSRIQQLREVATN